MHVSVRLSLIQKALGARNACVCIHERVCVPGVGGRAVMVQMGQHMTREGVGTLRLSSSIWTPL